MLQLHQSKLNLDEVVFANRNQAYGAYALRKQYPNHLKKSLAAVLFALATIPLLGYIMGKPQPPMVKQITTTKNAIVNVVEIILEQPALASSTQTINNATNNTGYKITADAFVKKTKQQVTTIINPSEPGTTTGNAPFSPPTIGKVDKGIIAPPTAMPPIIDFADVMPVFDNGNGNLYEFLQQKMSYPELAFKANREGKVVVLFEVDELGNVRNAQVIKSLGFGCDEEAIRVVQLMPKWKPALQNGKPVPVRMRLPINFTLQ